MIVKKVLFRIAALFLFTSAIFAQERIVSLGGTLTEIIFELGAGDRVVGVDATSIYPQETEKLTNLGYRQSINLEGIVSLKPDLVIASSKLVPKKLINDLKKLKVNVLVVQEKDTIENARFKIKRISKALNKVTEGKKILTRLNEDVERVRERLAKTNKQKKKLVFIYARGGNRVFLSGENTAAHEMIRLAGAKNAFSGVEGFKPVTAEALMKSNPDAIIMLKSGKESLENIWSIKGVEHTKAGKAKKVILVDDLAFLEFGPRSGNELFKFSQAIQKL